MRGTRVVITAIIRHAVRVAIVARNISINHGEGLSDVAPTIRALDRIGKVDVGGASVDRLTSVRRHDWVGDDDLLTWYQCVVGGRVQVEIGSLSTGLVLVR